MSVAWAVGAWATNSWLGMNGGPPNAWRGASTPPAPFGRSGLGGDDVPRRSPHRGWDRKAWQRAQDDLDALETTLRETYAALTNEAAPLSVLAQVDAIVRPAAHQEARHVPLQIDWGRISRDFHAANRLMALARTEAELRAAMDDDDDIVMLIQ